MSNSFEKTPEYETFWKEQPHVIRGFITQRPRYQKLCEEVAYILEKRIQALGMVEVAAITHRTKELSSFVEKIVRKEYDEPLSKTTDIAGARVVYLYTSDYPEIERIIEAEFNVIEKVDKMADMGTEKFGYGAVHFLVTLGQSSLGARYDDLKGLVCEIQVRTVMQDAWAIIDHHLAYKQEAAVPAFLKRQLNRLAALLEEADYQFNQIREERANYVREIESKLARMNDFLNQESNLDTVRAFLKWRFTDMATESSDEQISWIITGIDTVKYPKLSYLDDVLTRTEKARKAYTSEYGPSTVATGELSRAIAFDRPSYRAQGWSIKSLNLFRKYEHLVEKRTTG